MNEPVIEAGIAHGARRDSILFVHGSSVSPTPVFDLQIPGRPEPLSIHYSPSRCGGGATLIASSMVVLPAATFIAALMRSGFIPSL